MIPHHPERKNRRFAGTGEVLRFVSSTGVSYLGSVCDESSAGIGLELGEIVGMALGEKVTIDFFGVPTEAIVRRIEPANDGLVRLGCQWIVA